MESRAIDTHAHLFLKEFEADLSFLTYRARQVCAAVLLPNLDVHTLPQVKALVASEPFFYYGMIGLHPAYVKADFRQQLALLESELAEAPWVAIGEVGIDLFHHRDTFKWQAEAFAYQIEWAQRLNLPLSIHFREALDETLHLLHPYQVRGVFHCFTGSYEEGKRIIEAGFYLGIGGVLTYKNALALQEAVKRLPLDRFVLETDSPYLAPVPFRGRRNESSYVVYVARALAALHCTSEEAVLNITTQNALELFGLSSFKAT
ncbi:MAG: TatD family hydrolase [Bacteroidia bacterium]|nr:TatD family hydrolase [Bacteroidia bacterium]MDW8015410.1 TatD family hydrolase [Bacteroidia bacterium]